MLKKTIFCLCTLCLLGVLVGCEGNAEVEVTGYTSGGGWTKAYVTRGIKITSASFKDDTLIFTYKNDHDDKMGAEVCSVVVKAYNKDNVLVSEKTEIIFPGQVSSLPCPGTVVSIPLDTKKQKIRRVAVEHVCTFSSARYKQTLDRKFGF